MAQPIYIVDAFANEPFRGNPAAVCPLAAPADPAWMQQVAAEMNLAETAFLYRQGDVWLLRWFTPTVEVDLCGHATLASAHVLWESNYIAEGPPVRFVTRGGLLSVARRDTGYEMDFPARPVAPTAVPAGLADALGATPAWVGTNGTDLFADLGEEGAVVSLRPDLGRLRALPVRGVIVTARSSAGADYDFVSRFFAPASGIPEDPVTGSAHCALGPYWAERLGKAELTGYQASRRGGRVRVVVRGGRVLLGGRAVTVLRGELTAGGSRGAEPWPLGSRASQGR
jgi:PhzF family phenazine biosynthesis protein